MTVKAADIRFEDYGEVCLLEGRFADTSAHVNLASCVLVGLDRPVTLVSSGRTVTGDAVTIAPGIDHTVDFYGGRCLLLFFEGLETANAVMQRHAEAPDLARLSDSEASRLIDRVSGCADTINRQNTNLARGLSDGSKRTAAIAAGIREKPFERLSQFDGAQISGLERTQFLRTFKNETGMTFRAFKTWQAIKHAIVLSGSSKTIEAAALDSGFYDAAHFSNTFRKVFGVSPSSPTSGTTELAR